MKAITTKYVGPRQVRGARYIASDADANRVIVPIDHALNSEQNHDAAANALARKMGWTGTLVRGSLKTGNVYVWLNKYELVRIA